MLRTSLFNLNKYITKNTSLFKRELFNFSANKLSPQLDITQIRNGNLKFQTNQWFVNLYPFYPQVYKKKGKTIYQISTNSIVLAMSFINKQVEDQVAWANRKTMSFKFKDLCTLLNAQIGSGRQVSIQSEGKAKSPSNNSQRHRVLKIKDVPQQHKINISLSSVVDNTRNTGISKLQAREQQWNLQTSMPYSQYRIMYKILQNSLLDLSGWKFMMEVQKRSQFKKIDGKSSQDKQIDELFQG